MAKMWAGRFLKETDKLVDEFNSSIKIDKQMYKQDIEGSIAHANMLAAQNIIDKADAKKIVSSLKDILLDIENGVLAIDPSSEDIHMFIEEELTNRIGDAGKKLHTARSRNDQVAVDTKLYIKEAAFEIKDKLSSLVDAICQIASKHTQTIMPGYTHLQRAQPITFAHHLLAYAQMLLRDIMRIQNTISIADTSPLGAAALAGTTFNIDREETAKALGFSAVAQNSIDAVSDRDYIIEIASDISIIMMHLSRLSEEIVLWCSWEFKFIELDDSFATGSSIMPQKKNPDIAELIRGKTAKCYGNLITLLTAMKNLPLAYNKDMQIDKEVIFDSIEIALTALEIYKPMLFTMKVNDENMLKASKEGFINATDLADYLVKKNMPFRDAYKIVGQIVSYCILNKKTLESLAIEEYKKFSELIEADVYESIDLLVCVTKRNSQGGPSPKMVKEQIKLIKKSLEGINEKN